MAKGWGETFGDAFLQTLMSGNEINFKKWQTNKMYGEGGVPVYSIDPTTNTLVPVGNVKKGSKVIPPSQMQSGEEKTDAEVLKKAKLDFGEYVPKAMKVWGALDKIDEYAQKLPEFKEGLLNQTIARGQVGLGQYSANKVFSEYDSILSGELIPTARDLQEEKGPITEWDVGRVEKGLGQKNLPYTQKKVIIQESRNKVAEQVLSKLEASEIDIPTFSKKYPSLYNKVRNGKIRFTVGEKKYLIPFDEVPEFKKEMGL